MALDPGFPTGSSLADGLQHALVSDRTDAAGSAAPTDGLTRAASHGVLWSGANVLAKSAIRFFTTAILAHQLLPADFGVLGMALMFNEIVSLVGGLSLGVALIQRRAADESYFHTMFWANLVVGVVLGAAFFLAAPLAARFFRNDAVRPVVMVMSLSFLLTSVGGVHRALITRRLEFKKFALMNLVSALARSAVSLWLVFTGWGLWGVVYGIIAERVAALVMLVVMVPWWPRLEFHWSRFMELFRFSRNLYADNFVRYFNSCSDFLLTGRFLGATALGFYQLAYNLPHLVLTHFSEAVSEVLFPVYCRVQDDDERFRRGYTKTVTFISLVTFPLMAGLIVVAPEFITAVYGERWLSAVRPMQILCFSGAMTSVMETIGSVFNAKGRPDIGLKWNAAMLPLTVLTLLFASRWGVVGIAAAMSGLTLMAFVPLRTTLRLIHMRVATFLQGLLPAATSAGIMVLALVAVKLWGAGLLQGWPRLASLSLLVAAGAAVYTASAWWLWREAFLDFVGFVRRMAGWARA